MTPAITPELRERAGKDRPIIFSAPMIRAIQREIAAPGTGKTQTRRILTLPTKGQYVNPAMGGWEPTTNGGEGAFHVARNGTRQPVPESVGIWHRTTGKCLDAPYQVGDRLWVRETWQAGSGYAGPQVAYRATNDAHDINAWDGEDEGAGPSFNYDRLPGLKWHTWLPDLLSGTEGSWRSPIHMPRALSRLTLEVTEVRVERLQEISCADAIAEGIAPAANSATIDCDTPDPREEYRSLWNSIHGADAWDANPWVVVVSFQPFETNIDRMPERQAAPVHAAAE